MYLRKGCGRIGVRLFVGHVAVGRSRYDPANSQVWCGAARHTKRTA
jgi:hypothetical protein